MDGMFLMEIRCRMGVMLYKVTEENIVSING